MRDTLTLFHNSVKSAMAPFVSHMVIGIDGEYEEMIRRVFETREDAGRNADRRSKLI